MKILYIHGYGGKANGSTSGFIKKTFPNDEVFAPTYSYWAPNLATKQINDYINQYNPDVVIGTSLGGFYVLQINCGLPRIVINPATPEDIKKIDPNTAFVNILQKQFECMPDKTLSTVSIFFGIKDGVATHRDEWIKRFMGKFGFSIRYVNMSHEVSEEFISHDLKDLLEDLKFWINTCGIEKYDIDNRTHS